MGVRYKLCDYCDTTDEEADVAMEYTGTELYESLGAHSEVVGVELTIACNCDCKDMKDGDTCDECDHEIDDSYDEKLDDDSA